MLNKFEILYIILILIKIACIFILYISIQKQINNNKRQIQKIRAKNLQLIFRIQKMLNDKIKE